jgi:hypothetical protein
MPNRIRHILSSALLVLFLWQIGCLCGSFLLQNDQVSAQAAYFIEELEEGEDLFDGFGGAMSEEEVEEHFAFVYVDLFFFPELNSYHSKDTEDYYLPIFSKIPIPPPEMIS